jgi:hypothetical protein
MFAPASLGIYDFNIKTIYSCSGISVPTRQRRSSPVGIGRRRISSATSVSPKRRQSKVQISLTVSRSILEKIDVRARKMGQSRAALIGLAMYQFLGKDAE